MRSREVKLRDKYGNRSVCRIVWDRDLERVYIETEGNHDGVVVYTTVGLDRATFASELRGMGVLS